MRWCDGAMVRLWRWCGWTFQTFMNRPSEMSLADFSESHAHFFWIITNTVILLNAAFYFTSLDTKYNAFRNGPNITVNLGREGTDLNVQERNHLWHPISLISLSLFVWCTRAASFACFTKYQKNKIKSWDNAKVNILKRDIKSRSTNVHQTITKCLIVVTADECW